MFPAASIAVTASVLVATMVAGASAARSAEPGQFAYVGKYQGTPALYLANADGSSRTLIARGVSDHTTFSWSPDGRRLAFTRGGGSSLEIWVVNADGTGLKQVTRSAGKRRRTDFDFSENPSWSPDGRWLAFDGERRFSAGNGNQVFVIHPDGTGERQLTHAQVPEWVPAWAPDGRILFEHWLGRWSAPDPQGNQVFRHDGRIDLFTINAQGGDRHRIARVRSEFDHCACAAWSPDGTQIVYEAAEAGGKPDIWVMDADGTARMQLTDHPARDENPDWSPDGTQIAFYSERTGNAQIWVIDAGGNSPERRVTHDPWYDQAVRWRPSP